MSRLIHPDQITLTDYRYDPPHEFVAGVRFSLAGYGSCSIAIADKTDKTLVTVLRLAKPKDAHHEEDFIRRQFERWHISDWRFLSEAQQEARIYSMSFRDDLPITFNTRAAEIVAAMGYNRAHLHRVDFRRTDGGWYPDMAKLVELIGWNEIKIADARFKRALCEVSFEENNMGGYRIRFPIMEADLIYAGLLACVEMNQEYFTESGFNKIHLV